MRFITIQTNGTRFEGCINVECGFDAVLHEPCHGVSRRRGMEDLYKVSRKFH